MKNSGVTFIQPGIESISSSLLKRMDKGAKGFHGIQLLRYARCFNIRVGWNILYGFVEDTEEEYLETKKILPYLIHLQPPTGPVQITIDRFSPNYEFPDKHGIQNVSPIPSYDSAFPAHTDLDKYATHFKGDYNSCSLQNPQLIAELQSELVKWRTAWETQANDIPRLSIIDFTPELYLLTDTRKIDNLPQMRFLDKERAGLLLGDGSNFNPEHGKWALDSAYVLHIDNRYVPLVTSYPELLEKFH